MQGPFGRALSQVVGSNVLIITVITNLCLPGCSLHGSSRSIECLSALPLINLRRRSAARSRTATSAAMQRQRCSYRSHRRVHARPQGDFFDHFRQRRSSRPGYNIDGRLGSIGAERLQTDCGTPSACAAPCRGYYVMKNNAYWDAARGQGRCGCLAHC